MMDWVGSKDEEGNWDDGHFVRLDRGDVLVNHDGHRLVYEEVVFVLEVEANELLPTAA
jgi:hypothetical protein